MKLAIFTRQIGHYHNARYLGAADVIDKIVVFSAVNEADFSELLSSSNGEYEVESLFSSKSALANAVRENVLYETISSRLMKVQPDALAIAGWTNPESLAALKWARIHRIPVVVTSETQADDGHRSPIREFVKRRLVGLCDAALVGGDVHRSYLTSLGMPAERIHLGYNAVGNAHFEKMAELARQNEKKLKRHHKLPEHYLLASARFIAKKNLFGLIEAYALAKSKANDIPDLIILGGGELRGEIEDKIETEGLSNHVHLPGYRGYDDLPVYYGLSDGFLHVSLKEQWGLVVNEAMASGVPVIVSNACGVARTVVKDGESGWIVEPTDIDAISGAILKLHSMSEEERTNMSLAARKHISDWGPQRYAQGMKDATESAMSAVHQRRTTSLLDRAILHVFSRHIITSTIT